MDLKSWNTGNFCQQELCHVNDNDTDPVPDYANDFDNGGKSHELLIGLVYPYSCLPIHDMSLV